jgi:Spy/CpxP family protein refolding chaperone
MAETDEQAVKEKTVAKKVKAQTSGAKMMPAPEVQLKRLAKGLKLTAEQKKQIRPMLKEEYASLKEIRQDENLSPKQIQAKVEALRTETIAKIQSVLTPEQIEKHNLVSKEIKANKQKRIQENRKDRIGTKADPPPTVSK